MESLTSMEKQRDGTTLSYYLHVKRRKVYNKQHFNQSGLKTSKQEFCPVQILWKVSNFHLRVHARHNLSYG